ncbi:MAG: hypothetical protein ABIQ95_04520 [Bdellovibrionia bacterium]
MLSTFLSQTAKVFTSSWKLRIITLTVLTGLISSNGSNSPYAYATPIIKTNPFPSADPYGLSPFWKWKTIESENFFVTFPEELSEVANRATNYLEEAQSILSPILKWKPSYKPQVLVIDNQDTANGLTTPLAKFGIILWAIPPDSTSSTNFYDNWLRLLIIHEYTHFLNMDTTYGVWKALRPLFGAAFLPNAAWPPWMLEGLAVFMETQFTHSGRGRSSYYEMVLRAAVEEKVLDTPNFVTLDRITGTNPYFPGGDTRYLFGYYLMNQVALSSKPGLTYDLASTVDGGTDTLGLMSERSGSRIPLFINGNLENITGKDWYEYWQDWIQETEARGRKALDIIHSQPITQYTLLTPRDHSKSNEAEGLAISSDGQWLAYNLQSANRRPGLFLRNLITGKTRLLGDKLGGVGMNFTPAGHPDSDYALVYSELNRDQIYDLYSDLKLYDLKTDSVTSLTNRIRAHDPDVSRDGQWVVFTVTESPSISLARARLIKNEGKYSLGPIEKLYTPPRYDRVANPKFSADGQDIYFTVHPHGKFQEDLVSLSLRDPSVNTPTQLVVDGNFNRFPSVNQKGDLYFISNSTGVDNLYRYGPQKGTSILVTNMTSGISLPAFNLSHNLPEVYASVFSSSGWDVALVKLSPQGVSPDKLQIPRPLLPRPGPQAQYEGELKTYPITDYFFGQTLFPRVWTPLLEYSQGGGLGIGAEILGFDATNRHRYILAASYNTAIQTPDFFALYSNRSWGPTLAINAGILSSRINSEGNLTSYMRQADISATLAYPIFWTYSALSPAFSFNVQRAFAYQFDQNNVNNEIKAASAFYPSLDGMLSYSNQETANLSITSESGRYSQIGARLYILPEGQIWKGLLIDQEFIKVADHTILTPSLKALMVSSTSETFSSANSVLTGRLPQISNSFAGNGFNQLSIRGYPGYEYLAKAAFVTALDLTFPIARIFRGWGTNPFFLNNLYGFTFVESSFISNLVATSTLPSFGGGLRLTAEAFTIPLAFSWEYHQGLNSDFRGSRDLFFQIAGSAPF